MAKGQRKKEQPEGRELRFCLEVIGGKSQTEAAKIAGYAEKSAKQEGYRLMHTERVRRYIRERMEEIDDQHVLTAKRTLRELSRLGAYDISDITDETGKLLPLKEMPEDVRRAIKSIKIDPQGRREVVFHEKTPALTTLARYHKLLTDNVNVLGKLKLEDVLAASYDEPGKPADDAAAGNPGETES